MILRTPPPRKRRAESQLPEDNNNSDIDVDRVRPSSNSKQILIYEDLPAPEHSHEHVTSEQMLCTYQCRQMVKSEFFDALSSAEKVAHDYRSKFEALNDHFAKADSERVKFRDKLLNTEQELAAAKGHEQMLQEQLRKEIEFSHEQLRKQIQSFSELELKFRNEADLRKKAESSAAKAEEKANISQEKLNTLSESIDREKKRLQNELVQLRSESKLSLSRISADLEKMECRAKNAEKESSLLKQQLEDLKQRLGECMQEKFEVEKELSKRSTEAPPKDTDLLIKHLQDELRNCASEVRAARKLKASHEDMELLKEKLYEEKRRREKAELDLLKVSELQLSVHKLENELSAWKSVIKEIPGVSSADDVPLRFAALQKELVDSMMKASEVQVRMKEIEVTLDAALLGKKNAESEGALAQKKAQSYQIEKERLESMLALIKKERDHLKDVVMEFQQRKGLEGGTESGSSMVQELEASLSKKESYVRELESSLLEQKDMNSRQHNEINMLNERLTSEARRIKMLEREDDRLRSEIALLESKLGHGDFSSANTKVLRMVNTLAVENEAKQAIEALQNELQKTKEKLQAIEELNKQSCNISDAGTVDSFVAGKLKQLKEQIATLEKREERYRTVFAERISVFRRACCELFGYKIVMDDHKRADGIPVTRFTLHSIYAMSDDEKLQFEYESGNTNIVMNEYASQNEISRQIEIFIRKMNSIPAFTANLTVESFNKRTLS